MPALKDDAKVVFVFDSGYGRPSKLDWDDLDLKKNFSLGKAANHCMVMNDAMVQFYAAQQQQQITANATTNRRHFVHARPGAVNSNLFAELPWYLQPMLRLAVPLFAVSPDKCAQRLLKGVMDCSVAGNKTGRCWSNIDYQGHLVADKTRPLGARGR